MSREGLMDDSGYSFEPSEAEQQAWNEGYLQGKSEAQEECERCIYSGWKDMPAIRSEAYEKGKADGRKEAIDEFKR